MMESSRALMLFGLFLLFVSGAQSLSLEEQQALLDLAAAFPLQQNLGSGKWDIANVASVCSGVPSYSWYGVGCSGPNVTSIALSSYSQTGTLPASLGNLTMLTRISLTYTNRNGTIPEEILRLPVLESLTLSSNLLSGPLPDFTQMRALRKLDLVLNRFNGTMGDNWGAMTNLTSLSLHASGVGGTISESLSSCLNLTELFLGSPMEGTIPSSLGQLPKLSSLSLASQFNGTFPSEISQRSLTSVMIRDTYLTGELPSAWSSTTMTRIYIATNYRLNGTLPESWGNISSLTDIQIMNTALTGTIPESWGNLTNLYSLYLNGNKLTGSLPSSFPRLLNLTYFQCSSNSLSGSPPDSNAFKNLRKLQIFGIGNNKFTSLGGVFSAPSLVIFGAARNNLQGLFEFPSGTPQKLRELDLSFNRLNGSLPRDLGDIPTLTTITISGNEFTGTIPYSIANSSALTHFEARDNFLSGEIPPFRRSGTLRVLDLRNNSLSYCWVEPDNIGSACYLDTNPLLCTCNKRICGGNVCSNCTITNVDGKNNTCGLPPQPNGFPSLNDSRCQSGIASNGHCCSSRCAPCETCSTGSCAPAPDGPNMRCNISCTLFAAGWANLTCRTFRDNLAGICTAGVCRADTSRCLTESSVVATQTSASCGDAACQRSTLTTCVPLTPVPSRTSVCYLNEPGNCAINNCDFLGRCLPPPSPVLTPPFGSAQISSAVSLTFCFYLQLAVGALILVSLL